MKLNRHKRFRRILRFYKIHYGLEAPFTLVTDSEFIQFALNGKIHIKEQIPKVLQDKCFPRVTSCTVHELRKKGESYSGSQLIAKRFDRIQCGHNKPVPEAQCITEVLRSKTLGAGVCVGIQDIDLRARIRFQFHNLPIFYIMGQVPILEEPASMAKGNAKEQDALALQPSQWEKKALGIENKEPELRVLSRKRKCKQPNPLSCKKKKKRKHEATASTTMSSSDKIKSTRRKRRKHSASVQASDVAMPGLVIAA